MNCYPQVLQSNNIHIKGTLKQPKAIYQNKESLLIVSMVMTASIYL